MKTFATALIVAAGLSLGAGAAIAAPVGAPGSATAQTVGSLLTPAQYYGGYGGYGPYGYRCWRERIRR